MQKSSIERVWSLVNPDPLMRSNIPGLANDEEGIIQSAREAVWMKLRSSGTKRATGKTTDISVASQPYIQVFLPVAPKWPFFGP